MYPQHPQLPGQQPQEKHARLHTFWGKGFSKALKSKVCIIGCGSLGSSTALAMAKIGIPKLTLVDRDFVEPENLATQQYTEPQIGLPKAIALSIEAKKASPCIEVHEMVEDFNTENAEQIISSHDLVIDGTDNFETRLIINETCVKLAIPYVFGSVIKNQGMAALFDDKICMQCVFRNPPRRPETCDISGVSSEAVSTAASLQVSEAMKCLTGGKKSGQLLSFNLSINDFTVSKMKQNPQCRVCKQRQFSRLEDKQKRATVLCGRNSVQILPEKAVDVKALEEKIKKTDSGSGIELLNSNMFLLRFRKKPYTFNLFNNGRCIIQGTNDESKAKSLYSRYIGN